MAAVLVELVGSWSSSGPAGLLLLLLLSVLLLALCIDCGRKSFELTDPKTEKNPSALISVVRLEEARENPMISQICSDEKKFDAEVKQVRETTSSSHQVAPQTTTESNSEVEEVEEEEEEVPVPFIPWRSHLVEPISPDASPGPTNGKVEEGAEPSRPLPH